MPSLFSKLLHGNLTVVVETALYESLGDIYEHAYEEQYHPNH